MRFSPHFQLFYFNDRLEFCEFFEWKIKRINNADLFSQPPLVIFTKVPILVEGTVCVWVYLAFLLQYIKHVLIDLYDLLQWMGAIRIRVQRDDKIICL